MPAITVYGSSSPRTPATCLAAAATVGRLAAQRGWLVVNGAGRHGCMGACTDACLAAGGRVRGVILRQFIDDGQAHPSLAELAVADDMRTRKRLLAEQAEAFLGLPGGPGTWEEIWEIAVQRQIGVVRAPLVLVDVDGCWEPVRAQLDRAHRDGLLYGPPEGLLTIAASAEAAVAQLDEVFARA